MTPFSFNYDGFRAEQVWLIRIRNLLRHCPSWKGGFKKNFALLPSFLAGKLGATAAFWWP